MRMEHENNYASKGVANTGLGLSIGALGLELLRGGGLGSIFGGVGNIAPENMPINRFELGQSARISELETELKLRDANIYTDSKLLDLYKYVDGKFGCIESQICQQNVYNATNTAAISCINGQIAQLMALTKTVIPTSSICPEPMARYNSFTVPTATTTT